MFVGLRASSWSQHLVEPDRGERQEQPKPERVVDAADNPREEGHVDEPDDEATEGHERINLPATITTAAPSMA